MTAGSSTSTSRPSGPAGASGRASSTWRSTFRRTGCSSGPSYPMQGLAGSTNGMALLRWSRRTALATRSTHRMSATSGVRTEARRDPLVPSLLRREASARFGVEHVDPGGVEPQLQDLAAAGLGIRVEAGDHLL